MAYVPLLVGGVLGGDAALSSRWFRLGREVLVVEDDRAIRDALHEALADYGHAVHSAEHGQEALDLLRRGVRPQVILLDLMMPVMNGFEFLALCRRTPECQNTPVIVVSAYVGPRDGLESVFRFVPKPIELERLIEAIELAVTG